MAERLSRNGGITGGAMARIARWVGSRVGGRAVQPDVVRAPDSFEETGVWGVGGPGMREPGSTGILRAIKAPERDADD